MEDGVHVPTGIRRGAYVPELESLRGIAILLVFLFHADVILGIPFRNRAETLAGAAPGVPLDGPHGRHPVLRPERLSPVTPFPGRGYGGRHVSRRDFYARRALRILPLFYVAVLVATVATSHHLADLRRALPYLCFLYVLPGAASPMFPYAAAWWSLAVELQFYAALPLIALASTAPGRRRSRSSQRSRRAGRR